MVKDGFSDTATKKPKVKRKHFNDRFLTVTVLKNSNVLHLTFNTNIQKLQPPVEETTAKPNETISTTTERYRISRKELGYILGRNYRGLQKLLKIELNDAANVSVQNSTYHRMPIPIRYVPFFLFYSKPNIVYEIIGESLEMHWYRTR